MNKMTSFSFKFSSKDLKKETLNLQTQVEDTVKDTVMNKNVHK